MTKITKDKNLVCYGCCHSGANDTFPGSPSGERPCFFCIRNPKLEKKLKIKKWYNGTPPVRIPMDCYHSLDMHEQSRTWEAKLNTEIIQLQTKLIKILAIAEAK